MKRVVSILFVKLHVYFYKTPIPPGYAAGLDWIDFFAIFARFGNRPLFIRHCLWYSFIIAIQSNREVLE